jgi:hypothetical protein
MKCNLAEAIQVPRFDTVVVVLFQVKFKPKQHTKVLWMSNKIATNLESLSFDLNI